MIPVTIDTTPWLCEVCGEFENNREDEGRCIVCNTRRGIWLCERCGKKNSAKATACVACGGPKYWAPPEPPPKT